MTRGGTRYDGSPSRFDHGSIGRPAVDSPHDRGARDQTNRDRPSSWSIIGRRRPGMEEPHDRGPIEPRSSRDRDAIEPRSHAFRSGIDSTRADDDRRSSRITIDARSWPDHGAIVARSWCNRGKNLRMFDR